MTRLHAWAVAGAVAALLALGAPPVAAQELAPTHFLLDLRVDARGTLLASHTEGLFLSDEGKTPWRQVLAERSPRVLDLGPSGLVAIGAAIHRSTDAGRSWTRSAETPPQALPEAFSADGRGYLYRCDERGAVLSSADFGARWEEWREPVAQPCSPPVFGGPLELMRAGRYELRRNAVSGWEPLLPPEEGPARMAPGPELQTLLLGADGTLHAEATQAQGLPRPDGSAPGLPAVYRSTDGGRSWTQRAAGPLARLLAVRGGLAWLVCPGEPSVCVDDGRQLRSLGVDARPAAEGERVVPGGDARLYSVGPYTVERWESARQAWQPLPLCGLPIGTAAGGTLVPWHRDCARPR